MSSRGSATLWTGRTKTKRNRRKPRCELGEKCPYKHHYQHALEYDHGGNTTITSERGEVSRTTASAARSFRVFSGAGRTSSTTHSSRRIDQQSACIGAAVAAMRRASTVNPQRNENSKIPDGRRKAKIQELEVITVEDSDEGSGIKSPSDSNEQNTGIPAKKRARNTKSTSILNEVIDLCDSSDEN